MRKTTALIASLFVSAFMVAVPAMAGSGCGSNKEVKTVATGKSCSSKATKVAGKSCGSKMVAGKDCSGKYSDLVANKDQGTMIFRVDTKNFEKTQAKLEEKIINMPHVTDVAFMPRVNAVMVSYQPTAIKEATIKEGLANYDISTPKVASRSVNVKGMTCGGCVKSVVAHLEKVDNVAMVDVNLETGIASVVTFDEVQDTKLTEAVKEAGFEGSIASLDTDSDASRS